SILEQLSQGDNAQPDCLTGVVSDTGREGVSIDEEQGDFAARHEAQSQQSNELPPPPDPPQKRKATRLSLVTLGGLVAGASMTAAGISDDLLSLLAKLGMAAGVIPGIAAAFLIWGGFHYVRLKRQVENTPTSKVRSLALGMVEIHGRARRMYALVSPMSQSACVWYRLRKYRKGRKKKWRLIQQIDSSHVAFRLDDGTGRIVVDPSGATVKAKTQLTGYPDQFMKVLGTFGRTADPEEKWIEDLIYEGTALYVLGFAQPASTKRKSLKERTAHRLRQLKLDHRALPRYDTDQNGHIDATEWQSARRDAEQEALREQLAEQPSRPVQQEGVMIAKGRERSLPFIITEATSEADLTRKYRLFSISLLAAGLVATVLAVFKFLQFLDSTQFN
ncbi:MAG: hypothetical protein JRE16_02860, partial [Deltaproteobacteria bacterium]|nr:hypothetical protein [Deltaproteobacteria bacterium]